MTHPAAKYGIYFGVCLMTIKLIMYWVNARLLFEYSPTLLIGLVVPLVFIYLSLKATRQAQEGYLSFGEGIKASFLTYMIGTLISVIFQFILFNFIDSSLIELSHEVAMDSINNMMESLGGQEEMFEELQEELDEIPKTFTFGQAMLQFMVYLVLPGIFYCLIMAGIMKKSEQV